MSLVSRNLMLRLSLLCLMINICLRGAEDLFNSPGISEIMFDHAPTTTQPKKLHSVVSRRCYHFSVGLNSVLIFATPLGASFIASYLLSGSLFPALMLSTIHSAVTNFTLLARRLAISFWILVPASPPPHPPLALIFPRMTCVTVLRPRDMDMLPPCVLIKCLSLWSESGAVQPFK